jgi:hypothetical protein
LSIIHQCTSQLLIADLLADSKETWFDGDVEAGANHQTQAVHDSRHQCIEAADLCQEGQQSFRYSDTQQCYCHFVCLCFSSTAHYLPSTMVHQVAAVNNELLRRHFLERTEKFLIPLQRYFTSLMPLQKYVLTTQLRRANKYQHTHTTRERERERERGQVTDDRASLCNSTQVYLATALTTTPETL